MLAAQIFHAVVTLAAAVSRVCFPSVGEAVCQIGEGAAETMALVVLISRPTVSEASGVGLALIAP